MTPEGKVKQRVKKILDSYKPDCWYFMPAARAYGQAGVSDFIGLYRNHMFAIETKAGNNEPTPMQVLQMNKIEKAGGKVFTIREDTVYKIADWFRSIHQSWLNVDAMLRKYRGLFGERKNGLSKSI